MVSDTSGLLPQSVVREYVARTPPDGSPELGRYARLPLTRTCDDPYTDVASAKAVPISWPSVPPATSLSPAENFTIPEVSENTDVRGREELTSGNSRSTGRDD